MNITDNQRKLLSYYRNYPLQFLEDCLGKSLTKAQKIFINNMTNTNNTSNSFMFCQKRFGRQFYYDILNQVTEILFGGNQY